MPRARKKAPAAPGGAAKSQRHDLVMPAQAPAAPTNMQYGAHNDSIAAQNALPLPASPAPAAGPASSPAQAPGGQGGGFAAALAAAQGHPGPDSALSAPSDRPGEPLSQGAPFGPGAGPEVLGLPSAADDMRTQLEVLYKAYPIREIGELLTEMTD